MLGNSIKKFALNQAFNYIEKDPIKIAGNEKSRK